MTDAEDTDDESGCKLPEEPEQLTLWRAIALRRDALCAALRRWDRSDHPLRRDLDKIVELHGPDHGYGARAFEERDEAARAKAADLRAQLEKLDREIRVGTRENSKKEDGFTILQLRTLAGADDAGRAAVARALVESWLRDRGDRGKRHSAALALWRVVRRSPATPSDFGELPDLEDLRRRYAEYRKAHDKSGAPRRVAKWIVETVGQTESPG